MEVLQSIIFALCLLFISMIISYNIYQTPVSAKTFIVNIYLYILMALLFIGIVGQYTSKLDITNLDNLGKMSLVYLIGCIRGIFLMTYDAMLVNHLGFILMLLSLSLLIGVSYKYSHNMAKAAILSAALIGGLTLFIFFSSEKTLISMFSMLPKLTLMLMLLIIIQIIYLFLFSQNNNYTKVISIFAIVLFIFFILADTSKILLESNNLPYKSHSSINYPIKSSGLILDYLNVFMNISGHK